MASPYRAIPVRRGLEVSGAWGLDHQSAAGQSTFEHGWKTIAVTIICTAPPQVNTTRHVSGHVARREKDDGPYTHIDDTPALYAGMGGRRAVGDAGGGPRRVVKHVRIG